MAGLITDTTKGIIAIRPKDSQGQVLASLDTAILHDRNGAELKEWKALSDYAHSFGSSFDAQYYKGREQRIFVPTTPRSLFEKPNAFALSAGMVSAGVLATLIVAIALVRLWRRRQQQRVQG
jgi:hypothetical protein